MTTAMTSGPTEPERRRSASEWIPGACFVLALLMAVFVLPTILRQSPPQTNQTAQLSPDAPQNNQQSLITALKRGTTSTAGAGTGSGVGAGGGTRPVPPRPSLPPVIAKPVPSACKYGYGNPPRQTFSVYSAPCALPWSGNNGGATAPGVTATEIRVGSYGGQAGRLCTPGSSDNQLQCDFETWINSRYQLYGRQMHFYQVATGGAGDAGAQAGAVNARAQNMFAVTDFTQLNGSLTPQSVNQKLVTWTFYRPNSFYRASAPYAWSWHASNDRIIAIEAELVCKQLAGKVPSFNEKADTSFDYTKPRKFAAVVLEQGGGTLNEDLLRKDLAPCGLSKIPMYAYTEDSGGSNLPTAVTAMKSAGITTILDFGDQLATTQMATAATQASYFPEWVAFGTHNLEDGTFDQGIDTKQWRHAIGTTLDELPRPLTELDWFIAACQVDPNCSNIQASSLGGESPLGVQSIFDAYIEMANGYQLAGPHLTPQSFQRGLQTLHRPPDPFWAVGGSFQDPDPWAFEKYAAFMWWNPAAAEPTLGDAGAWMFMNNGRRYTTGEVPTTPLPFFKSGVTQPTGNGTRQ